MINQQEMKNEEIRQVIINAYGNSGEIPDLTFLKNFGEILLEQKFILSVYDKNDNDIFCVYCVHDKKCSHAIDKAEEIIYGVNPYFKGEFTEKKLPLIKNDIYLGYIKIGYYGPYFYNESDEDLVKSFNDLFIAVFLLCFVISIITSLIIAGKVVKPLKEVIRKTKKISEGNYIGKINIHTSSKEINELVSSINNLANNLQEQLIMKKQMADNFTHEFLTPLTAIQGNVEAFIDGVFKPTKDRLENLKNDIERLSRLIYDVEKLITCSDDTECEKITYNIVPEIKNILKTFEKDLTLKKIVVNFSSNKKNFIYANKDRINQLIINLLSNAIKYSNQNGEIQIDISNCHDDFKIIVSDNGIGIDKNDIPYIFEYLYRTDKSRSRNTGGSGIGLYVVKKIVDAHNGEITVESQIDKGSKFTVIIPNKCKKHNSS